MLKTLVSENEANKGRETRGEGSRKRHRAAARPSQTLLMRSKGEGINEKEFLLRKGGGQEP